MDELIKLELRNLDKLPDKVSRPKYDRSELSPGIVHIGVGNFHRAHQAWYLHRLMQQGQARDWGIIGAGVRAPYDGKMRENLLQQDCLTTLIELDPAGVSAEVIGSMIDYLPVEKGNSSLIEAMADPAIRIVSLTVTEGGYFLDPVTGEFDAKNEEVLFDANNPDRPNTAFGAILAALKIRKQRGEKPFTVLSCDNLMSNGDVTRQTVASLARLSDPALADWVNATCHFPNSMVDCIVPATGEQELSLVRELGIADEAPVTHENFRQWVMEDSFGAGRPQWEQVGVTFTNAVHNYEAMKLRILNAGHQIVANAGEILSLETIADCMSNKSISAMFNKVQLDEIAPQVCPVPGMEPAQYVRLIEDRFGNEAIVDTTRRVAFDGSSRHAGFVLPIIMERIESGSSVQGLALVEAMWARMCEGTRQDGSLIEPNDPQWEDLNSVAKQARRNPAAWLEQQQYYGELGRVPEFADAFDHWLNLIWNEGLEAALKSYIASDLRSASKADGQPALQE